MSIRNMRNVWAEIQVDGRQNDIATGPKSKDGGMTINLAQNDNGESEDLLSIRSYANSEYDVSTRVYFKGQLMLRHTTNRYTESADRNEFELETQVVGDTKKALNIILSVDIPNTYKIRAIDYIVTNGELPCEMNRTSLMAWGTSSESSK